eukprot:7196580-Pyramimonas_sp.AAC.1
MTESPTAPKRMPQSIRKGEPLETQDVRWAPPWKGLHDVPGLVVGEARLDHVVRLLELVGLPKAVRNVLCTGRLGNIGGKGAVSGRGGALLVAPLLRCAAPPGGQLRNRLANACATAPWRGVTSRHGGQALGVCVRHEQRGQVPGKLQLLSR